MQLTLNRSLKRLQEHVLTHQFIIPLIERLHPGRIEFTHSPLEAGRDIVSFGKDWIGRDHILCVQVKAVPISFGVPFGTFSEKLRFAKTQGVTLENGAACQPHEVWLVSSHPFPEQHRRQLSDVLLELERQGIKIVGGEEVCRLLMDYLPNEVGALVNASESSVGEMISALTVHSEGRAFGFSADRRLDQFYVTATLSVACDRAYHALAGGLTFHPLQEELTADLSPLRHPPTGTQQAMPPVTLDEIKAASFRNYAHAIPIEAYRLPYTISGKIAIERLAEMAAKGRAVKFGLRIDIAMGMATLIANARAAVRECPRELNNTAEKVRRTWRELRELNRAIEFVETDLRAEVETDPTKAIRPLRVRVTRLSDLAELDRTLLVDGPPGCGKTTLLKMLTLELLSKGEKALYLACFRIPPSAARRSLASIAQAFAVGGSLTNWKPHETTLILDGLDEAALDLSAHIDRGAAQFKRVVISCRTAYATTMRERYGALSLAPFTRAERDLFFQKWFTRRPDLLHSVTDLIRGYPDVATHTTLPLIATIVAALVESGFSPRSRAEIYNQRLELLLSRWDRSRGVMRAKVDNPEAKRRFLRHLARHMHASVGRTRTIDLAAIEEVFEAAVGDWGYHVGVADVVDDLVRAHGVLIEEGPGILSFGHLTFQEHLTGEWLAREYSHDEVMGFLGDDWWREPLNFYASIKGDITDLIDSAMENETFYTHAPQLLEMASYAPYTSPGALDSLREGNSARRGVVSNEVEDD